MSQAEVPNEARQRQARLFDAIIARHPDLTRENLEDDFRLWSFEEYARLRVSGLLDPLIRAQEGDDDMARAERVEDFLKELRIWGKYRECLSYLQILTAATIMAWELVYTYWPRNNASPAPSPAATQAPSEPPSACEVATVTAAIIINQPPDDCECCTG